MANAVLRRAESAFGVALQVYSSQWVIGSGHRLSAQFRWAAVLPAGLGAGRTRAEVRWAGMAAWAVQPGRLPWPGLAR
jgi:hypothetical protein